MFHSRLGEHQNINGPEVQKLFESLATFSKSEASKSNEASVKAPELHKVVTHLPSSSGEKTPKRTKRISPKKRKEVIPSLSPIPNEKPKKQKGKRGPFPCPECPRIFKSKIIYDCHLSEHAGVKLFTCHECGKQFGQPGSLYYHLKHVHDGVKDHACDICGRCFALKNVMQDHRRTHTGERPYICDTCGKTFKTKAALYIHSKTHSDLFPHKCSYCGKLFKFRQQMLGHMTIHTGVKNHTCDMCGKSFGVKWDLTRHLRVHSKDKPYVCAKCGVCFAQSRYLTTHERTKHKTP